MTDPIPAVLDRIDADFSGTQERLFELLRIPSISTDPAYAGDCSTAADWLVTELQTLGFEAEKLPSDGLPVVVGQGGERGTHVLFYGHYDVQPVDPIELWEGDPFDPQIIEGFHGPAIRARGASDDKGQVMTFLAACRAWRDVTGRLPCRITVLLEGEEEIGSPSLAAFLSAHRAALQAEVALICDTGLFDDRVPAIVTSLRGLLAEEFTITGPNRDLHSGGFGGMAMNPARVMTQILGGLHDDTGRVQVPGFYDGVEDIDDATALAWKGLGFSEEGFLGKVGLSTPAGEAGRTGLEQLWARPTAEINGITSGYTGDGFKTVLPSKAHAKVSFRLVGGQDPLRLRRAFRDWISAQLPPDCEVQFGGHGAAPGASIDTASHPVFDHARNVLSEEWGEEAAFIGVGGSIPVTAYFQDVLGMQSMLMGFARSDNRNHSPNEKYDLDSFQKGARSWARLLGALGV